MPTTAQPAHQLACLEVWGGNRNVSARLELPGLLAWVDSHPHQAGESGGDLHYLSACNNGVVARIALADVSGHGEQVARLAERLRDLMRQYVNYWDQSEFVRGLNDAFPKEESGVKYASAVILGFYRGSGELLFTNAGHLPPLWYRAALGRWELLEEDSSAAKSAIEGLPLGLIPGTEYRQTAVQLEAGDLLVLYTDGLSESRDATEKELGFRGLLELVKNVPVNSPERAGAALLDAVANYRAHAAGNDDETLIVLQRGKSM
jgi:sigma-B regulation protein RsbU (phosphoserine phosphatase)